MTKVSIISIVDDDNSVRESLHSLLRSVGFSVQVFTSAEEFLNSDHLDKTDCLILDVRMPEMTGIELQQQLRERGCQIPIIFISAHANESTKAQALGGGAVTFLLKPLNEEMVLNALKKALRSP
jgi:FixJ family two-component response regulator